MQSKLVKSLIAAAVLGTSFIGLEQANAMPIVPGVAAHASSLPVEQTGWRCGPGWHVNPWGRCVPNGRPFRRHRHW